MPARPTLRSLAVAALLVASSGAAARAQQPAAVASRGVNPAWIDTSCAACADFFGYANGNWVRTAVIPASYPGTGGFMEIYDRNTEALRRLLDRAASSGAGSASDPVIRKLGAFYGSCMDSTRDVTAGIAPVASLMKAIDDVHRRRDLVRLLPRLQEVGIAVPFAFMPEADPKASTTTIGQLYQAGLGLPDREYYLRTDPAGDSIQRAYVLHVERMLALGGMTGPGAHAAATRVMRLETALATASMPLVEQRDPNKVYHKMTVAQLRKLAPAIDWSAYFAAMGVPALASSSATLDVSIPVFLTGVSHELQAAPLEDWKDYLRWQVLHASGAQLGGRFFDESFRLQALLSGVKEPLPRWKRCAQATDAGLGEALGKAYVDAEFTPAAKARILELVNNLQAVFAERIAALDWMSDSTKRQARVKLDAILKKIAYPDTWRDYSALAVGADAPFATNWLAARRFETRRQLGKIGKPVDRMEWGMTPPTVNAYYNPAVNEIVFPAGILEPPFFDPQADDAVNYGGIGMVIGHEMTHGFDDQGRQYDAQGNLRDWWQPSDAAAFTARAAKVVNQYNGYVAIDTLHVNGKLTLGENIADIGGLTIAYYAWQRSLEGKPRPASIDGFTPEQRFFLGFAQAWHAKQREEMTRMLVGVDPHSPDRWRVNGAVSNMPEFARAFGCKAGDRMVLPAEALGRIW